MDPEVVLTRFSDLAEETDAAAALSGLRELEALLDESALSILAMDLVDHLVPLLQRKHSELSAITLALMHRLVTSCSPRDLFLSMTSQLQHSAMVANADGAELFAHLVKLVVQLLARSPSSGRHSRLALSKQALPVMLQPLELLAAQLIDREEQSASADPELTPQKLGKALNLLHSLQAMYLDTLVGAAETLTGQMDAKSTAAEERSSLLGFVFALLRHAVFADCLSSLAAAPPPAKRPFASAASSQAQSSTAPASPGDSKSTAAGSSAPEAKTSSVSASASSRTIDRLLECVARCGLDLQQLASYFKTRQHLEAKVESLSDEWSHEGDEENDPMDEDGSSGGGEASTAGAGSSSPSEELLEARASLAKLPQWSVLGIGCFLQRVLAARPSQQQSQSSQAQLASQSQQQSQAQQQQQQQQAQLDAKPSSSSSSDSKADAKSESPALEGLSRAFDAMPQSALLSCAVPYALSLLSRKEVAATACGLQLTDALCARVQPSSLPLSLLEDTDTGLWGVFQLLTNAMVQCPLAPVRSRGLPVLLRFLALFDAGARFELITTGMRDCPFPSVAALLVHQLKEEVLRAYPANATAAPASSASSASSSSENGSNDGKSSAASASPVLSPTTLAMVFELLSGNGDVTEKLDVVVAALNLYRFLLLKDKQLDLTKAFSTRAQFARDCLLPLKARMEATLKDIDEKARALKSQTDGKAASDDSGAASNDRIMFVPAPAADLNSLLLAQSRVALAQDLLNRVLELCASSNLPGG